MNNAEDRISKFYNTVGWETEAGITEDARRYEDLREYAREYVSKCRLRVLAYIPEGGANLLDMASGPIQYIEYLEYSKNFKKRYCIDLSAEALECAKKRIGNHGVFLHGSFFDIPLEENYFDCTISLHTIYHIDKDKQEYASSLLKEGLKYQEIQLKLQKKFGSGMSNTTLQKLQRKTKETYALTKRVRELEEEVNLWKSMYFELKEATIKRLRKKNSTKS